MSTFVTLLQSVFTVVLIFHCSFQRGQKHDARPTETVSWRCLVPGAPDHPLDSTSLHVTRTAPTNPCSATAVPATAGAWTETGRRSLGLALGLAADRCVSKSHVLDARQQETTVSFACVLKDQICLTSGRFEEVFVDQKTFPSLN